jgi:hypothetical protein
MFKNATSTAYRKSLVYISRAYSHQFASAGLTNSHQFTSEGLTVITMLQQQGLQTDINFTSARLKVISLHQHC